MNAPQPRSLKKVLCLFGTRPEVIKMAPVIKAISRDGTGLTSCTVSSSQHTDLLVPLIEAFGLKIDHDLKVMQPNQTLSSLASRVLAALDPVLVAEKPDAVLVQGDTTTALAGALAAFHRQIPVGHVEAGLRSGNRNSPFPEEMNRRLITQIAQWHFAATEDNRDTLLAEGANCKSVFLTGNPVIDALLHTVATAQPSPAVNNLLKQTDGLDRILLTTHRRESFGDKMADNLKVLRDFVARNRQVALIFPMHPNPSVSGPAKAILGDCDRVFLIAPLDYQQFVLMMARSWVIVSDSGGVQEEAPSLGKALLVLRENTERPEAVKAGCAKLVGQPAELLAALDESLSPDSWTRRVKTMRNPFGDGHAASKIADVLSTELNSAHS